MDLASAAPEICGNRDFAARRSRWCAPSCAIRIRGRVLAEAASDSAPFTTLLAAAPESHATTLYLWLGDWFAWVALAVLAGAFVQLVRLRRS